jgi:hypothetical protein
MKKATLAGRLFCWASLPGLTPFGLLEAFCRGLTPFGCLRPFCMGLTPFGCLRPPLLIGEEDKDAYFLMPNSPSQPPLVSRATSSRARASGVLVEAAMNLGRQSGPNFDLYARNPWKP